MNLKEVISIATKIRDKKWIHPKKSLSPEKFHKEATNQSPKNFELTPNGVSDKKSLDAWNKNRKSILIKKDNKVIDYLKNENSSNQQINKTRKQWAKYQINKTELGEQNDSLPNMETCDADGGKIHTQNSD